MSVPDGCGRRLRRRTLLKAAGATACGAALVRALAPITGLTDTVSAEELLQRHYKELTRAEIERICRRLEREAERDHGATGVHIGDPRPRPGTQFAYGLNLTTCLGCRQCAEACHRENNHDRTAHNSYIRVFEVQQGSLDLAHGSADYEHAVPRDDRFYMPVQCHHCARPPCVDVCPTRATWREPDGLVVVDYNWCIGCRYCEAACPYHARRFNWRRPEIPAAEINRDQAYLSNRIRPVSVMEKCTYCMHRVRAGRLPACLEACPAGARVFGNLLDPHSEIRHVLANKRVFVLKEDQGTLPRFFYFFAT